MHLCMPTSPRLKGWRTQLVSLIRSPSIRVTWRPWRPKARIAWCRYGNPDAKALPVPPQPMTAMWTTRPGVRIELSLYSDMGDEFLKVVAGGFQESHREGAAGAGKLLPESCRTRRVEAHFIPNGVGEVAAEECSLPMGKALHRKLLRRAHGPMAHFAVEVNVPEGSMKECGAALRPPAFGQRADGQLPAAADLEDQRRRRELLAGDRRQLRILVEKQGPGRRRDPPGGDEFIACQDVFGQHFETGIAAQPLDQLTDKLRSHQRGRPQAGIGLRGRPLDLVNRGEARAMFGGTVDQDGALQAERLAASDIDVGFHEITRCRAGTW